MRKTMYNYDDILLQPKYTNLQTRSEADTSILFGGKRFRLPIVPANMASVVDENLACWLASRDYFYIMHRFRVDAVSFAKSMREKGHYISISIGVNQESFKDLEVLKTENIKPDFITIDIAHGHCKKMQDMVTYTKQVFPESFLIAGNVCTPEGLRDLENWGADSVKVGIGPGSVCTTKLKTGFSCPQFSAVLQCSQIATKPVIADGGIRYNGDIAKALVAGADMVMVGGMLSGYEESPGEVLLVDGQRKKLYYGSASEYNKKHSNNVEGVQIFVDYKGPIEHKYEELTQDLRSSISYSGGKDISAFATTDYIIVH